MDSLVTRLHAETSHPQQIVVVESGLDLDVLRKLVHLLGDLLLERCGLLVFALASTTSCGDILSLVYTTALCD
eukprot:12913592-Prorocentrum_lima.AAC.1